MNFDYSSKGLIAGLTFGASIFAAGVSASAQDYSIAFLAAYMSGLPAALIHRIGRRIRSRVR